MPWRLVLLGYAIASVVTFVAYGLDKRAARRGRWRTREGTLRLLDLIGGFPGGLLGQLVFRHKTRKLSYQLVFWLIVALHAGAWTAWFALRPAG